VTLYSIAAKQQTWTMNGDGVHAIALCYFFRIVDFVMCNQNAIKFLWKFFWRLGSTDDKLKWGRRGWQAPAQVTLFSAFTAIKFSSNCMKLL
jgi:hypothetical protein